MSKQSQRRKRARFIRAAESKPLIQFEANSLDWIKAAEGGEDGDGKSDDQPKRFSMTAYTGGAMDIGYYDAPVVIDLAGMSVAPPLPILMNHDADKIVGHADDVGLSVSALKLAGVISGASQEATQVTASAGLGFPWKASVGARPDELFFVEAGVTTKANGKTFKGPVYVARKSTLGEVSFVAMAADGKTSAKVAATAAFTTRKELNMKFKEWTEKLFNGDVPELTEQQNENLKASYDAEVKAAEIKAAAKPPIEGEPAPAPVVESPKFDMEACVLAHGKHVAAIEALSANYDGKIEAATFAELKAAAAKKAAELKLEAMEDEKPVVWLEVAFIKAKSEHEVALIRAERPKAPAIHAGGNEASQAQAIEAALSLRAGLQTPEEYYSRETIDAAAKFRNIGLQETMLTFARANGYTGRQTIHAGNIREVMQAAFSTHTLTTLLTTTGNKLLLDGFNSVSQTWREIASVRSVKDFKTHTAYRMTADLEYEEVGPAGEIKHGTLGQETYTHQAKTYGKMVALTRQDIINDDLGAFDDLRNRLAIGQAIKMNKVFWTAFLTASNAGTFWTSGRGNLVTSSSLAEAGLNTAVKAFRDMAGPDGNLLSLEPKLLLVPSALEATARKLYASQEMRDTTASTKTMVANIYHNRFKPIVVPELGNSSYTGYSATTWFLLADPKILAPIAMSFLNGQEAPTIESTDADFSTLGIQFRAYHDFGADMSEYRSSVKATA